MNVRRGFRTNWISGACNLCIAALLVFVIVDIGRYAGRAIISPEFRSHVVAPQEATCVIRQDVCRLVEELRASGATTFQVAPDLNPEIYQRVVELAFPNRITRDAPVLVDFCDRALKAERARLRIADTEHTSDRNADLCIFDRR